MRLIDADLYKEDMTNVFPEYYEEVLDAQPTIDAVPLDGSFLKMSKGDYLIYKRHWLYEHFDMEMEIQRSAMKSMGYEPALKDAVPVIRCKNCRFFDSGICHAEDERAYDLSENHYCGFGEPKENEHE